MEMIENFREIAQWYKTHYNQNNSTSESVYKGRIRVYEKELKRASQISFGDGTLSPDISIALQTNSPKASEIMADDTIIYNGHEYSVQSVQGIKSALGLYAKEYIIYLR